MRKLCSLRMLVCLVGTLAVAATAVIGASLTDSAVTTEESATTGGEVPRPGPAVSIEPLTASADDNAAPTVVNAGESPTPDHGIGIGIGRVGGDIAPINGGMLDSAATAVRDGPDADPDLTTLRIEDGDGSVSAPVTTDISQVSVASDGGGVGGGGEGVPYASSATGLPSFVGPVNVTSADGGDRNSAAPVPEAAALVFVVFPLLAALIACFRG